MFLAFEENAVLIFISAKGRLNLLSDGLLLWSLAMYDTQFETLFDVLADIAASLRLIAACQADEADIGGGEDLDIVQDAEL